MLRNTTLSAWLAAVVATAAGTAPPAAAAPAPLANHCKVLASGKRFVAATPSGGYALTAKKKRRALRFYLKPTGLGTYLLYDSSRKLMTVGDAGLTRGDTPGPPAEWATERRARKGRFALRATLNGARLKVARRFKTLSTTPGRGTTFRFARARGCRAYPEAGLNTKGKPIRGTHKDGSLIGFADAHLHITADFRAGGQVISGESFDRFGITEALGHDADVHGSDGSLDITGNLLRSGSPEGTHDTHGWPSFSGWPTPDTYTHQQIYYRWLQRAWMGGLRLVVAQTVEDEPLCTIEPRKSHSCDETATIELEVQRLKDLQDYVDAQSGGRGRGWFRLVYTPEQARRVIKRGKLAVIIGVESSDPFGCSERLGQPECDSSDIDRGIARMREIGVRSMFIAHWVDNALAGAALEGGDKGTFIATMQVAQTGLPFQTGPCPHPGQGEEVGPVPGRQCNARGLTDLGAYAVGRLMDNHMLIEADHMSERARDDVLAIAEARSYPLVSSHTGTGGSWDPSELERLYALGGYASATVEDAAKMPEKVLAFRRFGAAVAPGLSTDTGGFAALPAADPGAKLSYPFRVPGAGGVRFGRERTGERTFELGRDGVAHYGLMPDLLAETALQPGGREALGVLFRSADAYVRTWALAEHAP